MGNLKYRSIFFFIVVIIFIILWSTWVAKNHPQNAIVSWDEGFHGGAALYLTESLRDGFNFAKYNYILNDFKNGLIWYLPLWLFIAGPLGVIFNPSVEVYRLATLIFACLSLITVTYYVKRESTYKAAFLATLILAFSPLFIIYSHLIMREVPLVFAITLALLSFYKYITKEKLNRIDIFVTYISMIIGVWAKIIGIAVIFGTVFGFGGILFLIYKNTKYYRRFYSKNTLYILFTALILFLAYRYYILVDYNADIIYFFINQSEKMSGGESRNLVFNTLFTLSGGLKYYFFEFMKMPLLFAFWFGALTLLVVIKRSIFSYFLAVWVVITYLSFSAVKPQSPQYILPIFAPLSIACGLVWGEIFKIRNKLVSGLLFVILVGEVMYVGVNSINLTPVNIWRNKITYQEKIVKDLVEKADIGERVIVNGDGTRFLVRLLGKDKKLQTINGLTNSCDLAVEDSTDWAIVDYGPQNPEKLDIPVISNWNKVSEFGDSTDIISLYRNPISGKFVKVNGLEFSEKICARWLLPGVNEINIFLTPKVVKVDSKLPKDLVIELRSTGFKLVDSIAVSKEELEALDGKEHHFSLKINNPETNYWYYYKIITPDYLEIKVSSIEIVNRS